MTFVDFAEGEIYNKITKWSYQLSDCSNPNNLTVKGMASAHWFRAGSVA